MEPTAVVDNAYAPARLLIVEDEPDIRNICARLLRRGGYFVAMAENGEVAFEQLKEASFDLVLTDIQMPRMSGMELLSAIRQTYPNTDVIVFTAHTTVETAREALKQGAFDYLSKPNIVEDLERTVRRALEWRRVRLEKERLSEIVALYDISRAFTSTLDTETAVREIVHLLWRRFAPEELSLSLVHPEDEQLELLASRGDAVDLQPGIRVPMASMNEETLLAAHHLLIGNGSLPKPSHLSRIPLRTGDHFVGVLQLMRGIDQPGFGQDDRTMLEVCALQIAASLENARLYRQIKEQNLQTILALVAAIDARDPYTRGHSEQVMQYPIALAESYGLSAEEIELIRYGALLHDIGKIGVRNYVLLKPGPLTDDEFVMMKRHPQIGADILRHITSLDDVIPMIRHHHERLDGTGYPDAKTEKDLTIGARIVAIADAYDAMTSDRAYRRAMSPEAALEVLQRGSGRHWDSDLVAKFIEMIRRMNQEARPDEAVLDPALM